MGRRWPNRLPGVLGWSAHDDQWQTITPINTHQPRSPNEVHPRGVPGDGGSQAAPPSTSPSCATPERHSPPVHPPSGQSGQTFPGVTEDTRGVGVPRRRRVGPTHQPTRPRRARVPSQTARARRRPIRDKRRLMTESWVFLPTFLGGKTTTELVGAAGRAAGGTSRHCTPPCPSLSDGQQEQSGAHARASYE